MKHVYMFDVDGTLTPSRKRMNRFFAKWFEEFATHNAVYFVTGSDRDKTIEQLGTHLYNLAVRVYNCSGNHVFEQDREIYRTDWKLPDKAVQYLLSKLHDSRFYNKTGKHIEERPGMVNFSICGRNADLETRVMYRQWDEDKQERFEIATEFNSKFPDIEALVAGETGLDIFPRGLNKRQVLVDFAGLHVHFFGDKMDEGGNDYPLAEMNWNGTNYHVKDWQHTWELLKELTE